MNNITIIYIIVVILVSVDIADKGSFQNQMEGPVSCGLPRRASKEVLPLREGLKHRRLSAPRGNPKAAVLRNSEKRTGIIRLALY